jgi:predicted HTH transcriptional regulator
MTYVMIAVFQIEELPDVIKEFISSGMVKSVKPAYERGVVDTIQKPSKREKIAELDRETLLEFIKENGEVGYKDLTPANLGLREQSISYNLKILVENGNLVRTGETKPYKYKVAEGA